ncbi:MAG TPA: 16S rRNA (uracil(1498)-N(3))-methyltransferase [Xanthobacteraceae bacterium]|nr:16S rRNA (uracil(1498)-N(3))-methyltransferase [Xanthobacteraceae bacterium]
MPAYDFHSPRIYVAERLAPGTAVSLEQAQAHYLLNVLRLGAGESVLVFNGQDGEWSAGLTVSGRKAASLELMEQTRAQTPPCDLHYLFSPLKHARLDYMVQKAVEMGASRLQPVLTRHTQVSRVNLARMRANAIEAAEQCGILNLPDIAEPVSLQRLIDRFEPERLLVFCDEQAEVQDPIAALDAYACARAARPSLAVLTGPEGGFAADERQALLALPRVVRLALGPRILRADTAAVAALAMVQAALGDWR